MSESDPTVDDILAEKKIPAIGVDSQGLISFVNARFEQEFGWKRDDLVGRMLSTVIPPHMREAHSIGFSRFLSTGQPRLLGMSLKLPILCGDGRERQTEHFIVAERQGSSWRLAALIRP